MAVRAVTIGFFDGVHIGHRRVLNTLLSKGGEAVAITFWPHPRAVLQQDARDLSLLSSIDEKLSMIRGCGVEDIRMLDFTKDFAGMTAETFIKDLLMERYGCTDLVLGYDNRLGSDGLSTAQVAALGRSLGLVVDIAEPCSVHGITVSSTRIRQALKEGDIALASAMLGQDYGIRGIVVSGNRIGRTLGFPTANLALSFPLKAVPANGVYAVRVKVSGRQYRGMTNIGVRPTVTDSRQVVIETNIFGFDEDIYGLEMELDFAARIRGERKFSSVTGLQSQLEEDKKQCIKLLAE